MSRYCLDTSAYSQYRRGDAALTAILDSAEWIGVPTITLGELRTGFLLGERAADNERLLQDFMAHPVVNAIDVDQEVSRHFAAIAIDLRQQGTPLPTNDVWIAACAARAGCLVLSYDRHFERIARVGALILPRT